MLEDKALGDQPGVSSGNFSLVKVADILREETMGGEEDL